MNSPHPWINLVTLSVTGVIAAMVQPPANAQNPDAGPAKKFTVAPQITVAPSLTTSPANPKTPVIADRSMNLQKTTRPAGAGMIQIAVLEDPAMKASAPTPPAIDDDVMAEIKEIRRQLGGGIGESLKGLRDMPTIGDLTDGNADEIKIAPEDGSVDLIAKPANAADDLFNAQLRNIVNKDNSQNEPSQNEPSQNEPSQNDLLKTQPAVPNVVSGQSIDDELYRDKTGSAKTIELRKCARGLEELAGRLESVASYEVADRLRAQAAILWSKSRQ